MNRIKRVQKMTLKGVMISTGKIITRAEKQLVRLHCLLIDHQTLFIIRLLYNYSTFTQENYVLYNSI